MAEGKKTFILYIDWIDDLEDITTTERGEIMTWLMEYVNDENPEYPEERAVKKVCRKWEKKLKEDLLEWRKICARNAVNGKNGGRPKTQKTQSVLEKPKKTQANPKNLDKDKDNDKEVIVPSLQSFKDYSKQIRIYKPEFDFEIEAKYDQWKADDWKDGNGNPIKNWKTKLQNTMPYFKGVTTQTARRTW